MKNSTQRLVLSILAAGLAILSACSKPAAPPAPAAPAAPALAKVKLALNWVPEPEFGGFYAARESGAYSKAGLDVEILAGGAGLPTVQMVASGQAQFGIVSGDEIVINRARGGDVVAIFAVYQHSPQGIMTHASRGFTTLADVFASPGTVLMEPGAAYSRWLEKTYGFSKVTVAPYSGGLTQFLADPSVSQQCYVTSEPVAARAQGADAKAFLVAESGYDPYATVVAVNGAWMREHPELVNAFLAATRAGWTDYLADPAPANAVMGPLNAAMDAKTFADIAEEQRMLVETEWTNAHGLGSMSGDRWTTLGAQLVELKVIETAPAATDCFADVGQ